MFVMRGTTLDRSHARRTVVAIALMLGGAAYSTEGSSADTQTPVDMVALPAGGLRQGSAGTEQGQRSVEGLPRDVHIPAFSLSRSEVTVGLREVTGELYRLPN